MTSSAGLTESPDPGSGSGSTRAASLAVASMTGPGRPDRNARSLRSGSAAVRVPGGSRWQGRRWSRA
jgi:hypothetical protein